jgi:ACS family D-galactonate transporter-like MFS transporter
VTLTELKPRRLHWLALWLLVVSICINYADRGTLGVAAKSLERELHLPPEQLGTLLGAFSLTYALSLLAAGKLIDRFNVNWLYAAAFLLWSGATSATGLANSFWTICILRLLLGVAESVAYPAYAKMICTSFPEQLRGTANGLIDAGSKLGPAVGVWLGVKMIGWFSWRGMFLVMGGASLAWLIPWCFIAPKLPSKVPGTGIEGSASWAASYREIMSTRAFWGTAIGLFGGNYAWFFLLNWLPYYLENDRHYTHDKLAVFGSVPFLVVAISSMSFGIIADWIIRRGHNAGRVRQVFLCIGLTLCGVLMLSVVLVKDEFQSNTVLMLSFLAMGAWSSNHWALSQTLAGTESAGQWTALQNCLGNFAGVLGPVLSGWTLQVTHSFFSAFAIACAFLLFGVVGYWAVIGTPRQVLRNPNISGRQNLAYIK